MLVTCCTTCPSSPTTHPNLPACLLPQFTRPSLTLLSHPISCPGHPPHLSSWLPTNFSPPLILAIHKSLIPLHISWLPTHPSSNLTSHPIWLSSHPTTHPGPLTHCPIHPLFHLQLPIPFLFTYLVSVLVVTNMHYHCTQNYWCWFCCYGNLRIGGWLLLFTTLFSHLHGLFNFASVVNNSMYFVITYNY